MSSSAGIVLTFQDDGGEPPRQMEMSASLAAAIARADLVNKNKDAFAVSFTSLFIGLLATPDDTGRWLLAQFTSSGADLDGLLRRRGLAREELNRLAATDPTSLLAKLRADRPLTRTRSARQALQGAEQSARAQSRLPDTADVAAALIGLPGFHDSDFKELRILRDSWAAAFLLQNSAATPPELSLDPSLMEPHVAEALRLAGAVAGSSPITPAHVMEAIGWMVGQRKVPGAFRRFTELVPSPSAGEPITHDIMPSPTQFDAGLRRQLALAQRPLPGATKPTKVWGRDLVTAVLLSADESDRAVVHERGRDLDLVRDVWYAFVTSTSKHRTPADWTAWWNECGVALPSPRRAGYSVETDKGDDKLGIDAEARAFAQLILDKNVQPPLSIGLLGDWGSGKSFFIEQIKKGIAELRSESRPELHKQVVEIEFNAWHASDSNLWASLVTNIFDAIWAQVSPADNTRNPQAARERLKRQIEQAHGAVHEAETQVELGRQALATAERDLEKKREILALNKYLSNVAVTQLQALARSAGWHKSLETINDAENAAAALAESGNRLRTLLASLLEKPILHIALPTALLLSATIAVWLLLNHAAFSDWEKMLSKTIATGAGLVGGLVMPLGVARQKVNQFAASLARIQEQYNSALAEAKKDEARVDEAQEVSRARRELESSEASVNRARARLADLLNEQKALDPMRRLGAFLQERVQSTQYRSQQGIISLVHRDFSELSRYMKDLRDNATKNEGLPADADAIRPVDRIIIYVDDLDRCRPAHVVNMLEAAHLLLALDLFVVVVAVDSRWLTRALEVYYHDLLTSGDGTERDGMRASTPQNYLEKIFQITYALAPMNPERFGDYVAFLAGDPGNLTRPDEKLTPVTHTGQPPPAPAVDPRNPARPLSEGGDEPRTDKPSPPEPQAEKKQHLASLPVRIGEDERQFIVRLAPLLTTPRIAKRLVNVYRVIKARKTAVELDEFEREARSRSCLLMLAILFGRPLLAADLLRGLHEKMPPFDRPEESLVAALRRRPSAGGETPEKLQAWQRLIDTLTAIGLEETVGACAREPREIARYSLVSGHEWHTWRVPTADSSTSTAPAG